METQIKEIFKSDEVVYITPRIYAIELSKATLRNLDLHKKKIDKILELGATNIEEWYDNATDTAYLQFAL